MAWAMAALMGSACDTHTMVPPRCSAHRESTVDNLCSEHRGGTIVCVSHADPIKAAMAHAMGTHLDLFQRIVISTCSISAVAYTTGGPIVLTVNSTGGSLGDLRPS